VLISDSAVMSVIKRICNRSANKSNHPIYNPLFSSHVHDNTILCVSLKFRMSRLVSRSRAKNMFLLGSLKAVGL
jgi:hypothetical protein